MMIVVSGPNGSGKSRHAEELASQIHLPRFYIATMVSQSAENDARIEKHRRQRQGLDFQTMEIPWKVGDCQIPEESLVLLEDASNLLANLIFADHGAREQALEEILRLKTRCRHLIVVTISGMEADQFEGETAQYIRDLQWLNEKLYQLSDETIEMTGGSKLSLRDQSADWS